MLKTIAYLLDKQYDFRVGRGKYIIIFDDIITFNDDDIIVKDCNRYFGFSIEDFHDSLGSIVDTIKDDTFTEEYAAHEGTRCPACGKIHLNTTWHDYVDIFSKEVIGSVCDDCEKLYIVDLYKKVGGVLTEDFGSTTTEKIRNYEEIRRYLL